MLKIYYSPRFAKRFKRLPQRIKYKAFEKERLFRKDPFDAGLKTHKLHGGLSDCWSFSVDYSVRIIFSFEGESVVRFHTIGGHEAY